MQTVIDMAKAHLQNVSSKIQELENQREVLRIEVEKLKNYLDNGLAEINKIISTSIE